MPGRSNSIVRGPNDRTRVDLDHDWECIWWSEGFGVSVEELRAAVKEVGPRIADIDHYLSCSKSVVTAPRIVGR